MISQRDKLRAIVWEIQEEEVVRILRSTTFIGRIGHENTASLIKERFNLSESPFSREPLTLEEGDAVICLIPQFRVQESREFTDAEIKGAKFRYFYVRVEKLE